jgi:SAM-dependent methyltransferase
MTAGPSEATYDGYAADYRVWWAPVIAPAAVSLLDRLDGLVEADATLVDIGAGTGTVAAGALRRWPGIRVIAVDPATKMLGWAETDAREAGVGDRLTVKVGEAAALPLPDGSVDIATSTFVLQLIPDRIAGVREALRVLRPGGAFAHLTWRSDDDPFEPEDVFDDALDALRIDPPSRADGVGESYPSPESAALEMRRAGFRDVRAREEWLVHRFTPQSYLDAAEHWTEEDVFATLDEPRRAELRAEVLRRLELIHPDALVWRRPLVSVIGRKTS